MILWTQVKHVAGLPAQRVLRGQNLRRMLEKD